MKARPRLRAPALTGKPAPPGARKAPALRSKLPKRPPKARERGAKRLLRVVPTGASIAAVAPPKPTFIDLFAGIGGMRLGFKKWADCVFTSEWNDASRETYAANFDITGHPFAGDITRVASDEIPKHDILVGGFPCQPFSIAGVSKKNALGRPHGFSCLSQGTLFFEIARIIRDLRPRAFLLENVRNLLSHDKGNTFEVIRQTLQEDLGYSVDWRVINAQSFVPQHRERIFIVGFRDPVEFDLKALSFPPIASGPRLDAILHPENGTEDPESHYTVGPQARVSDKYTLSNKLWSYLQGYAEKHRRQGNGFGFGLVQSTSIARTLSARYYKDGSEILVARSSGAPRRLTPRECARLMGFDTKTRNRFKIPVSDTQAYRQFGNAVVVPVVERLAEAITAALRGERMARARGQIGLFEREARLKIVSRR